MLTWKREHRHSKNNVDIVIKVYKLNKLVI